MEKNTDRGNIKSSQGGKHRTNYSLPAPRVKDGRSFVTNGTVGSGDITGKTDSNSNNPSKITSLKREEARIEE